MQGSNQDNFSDFNINDHIKLIKFICNRYVFAGFIKNDETEDFYHDVIEKLINRLPVLRKNYNGSVKPATYLTVVVNNICKELIRAKMKKEIKYFSNIKTDVTQQESIERDLIIEDEIERLQTIFVLFNKKRFKLEICLKGYFGITFTKLETKSLDNKLKIILRIANKMINEPNVKNSKKYGIIASIISELQNKPVNAEAIRKWIKEKIEELIYLLNGEPPHAMYDEESLGILLEKYYEVKRINI